MTFYDKEEKPVMPHNCQLCGQRFHDSSHVQEHHDKLIPVDINDNENSTSDVKPHPCQDSDHGFKSAPLHSSEVNVYRNECADESVIINSTHNFVANHVMLAQPSRPSSLSSADSPTGNGLNTQRVSNSNCNDLHTPSPTTDVELLVINKHNKPFTCLWCGEQFPTIVELCQHNGSAHAAKQPRRVRRMPFSTDGPFPCLCCGKQFSTIAELCQHNRAVHASVLTTASAAAKPSCEPEQFTANDNTESSGLDEKVATAGKRQSVKPMLCPIKGTFSPSRTNSMRDVDTACGSLSQSEHNYAKLELKLLNEKAGNAAVCAQEKSKPHKCQQCAECFSSHYGLQVLTQIHRIEKPYSCRTCGQAFKCRTELGKHVKFHCEENIYECQRCGIGFCA